MADKKGFSRLPGSSQRSTESCCSCCAAKVASSGEGIASQWKYAFNIESKWRWQRNYQRERQMDMDISAACQAHKWSGQVMTCTCRSMHAQVRRGLQQKFKFFIYKLQTFAKNSIWLEVQRTMDELLGIYIYKYICEYLWASVHLFSLSKLIKRPMCYYAIFQLKELSSWLGKMTTNWELLSTALAEVRIFV